MSSIRVVLCAALLLVSAACQKAEFEKTQPEAVVISLSQGVISADDATLTVSVTAVEEGVPLLEESVTATIGGACIAAPQTVVTGAGSGLAVFTFSGLDTAGACTVTATARDATSTASFTVVAGDPATITLTPGASGTSIVAGETIDYTVEILDAAGNDVPAGVDIATDAPGATLQPDGALLFTSAGQDFTVFADVIGFPGVTGTSSFTVDVAPAAAASVAATLDRTSLSLSDNLVVTCRQFDVFGNEIAFAWDAADVVVVPAATVTEQVNNNGVFDVDSFGSFGVHSVTCDDANATTPLAQQAFTVVQVVDADPPTQQVFTVSNAGPVAAGTQITVTFDVTDIAGVAWEAVTVVSGPGRFITSQMVLEAGATNPPARTFTLVAEGMVGVSGTVVVRAQAADATGNILTTGDLTVSVNAAPSETIASLDSSTVEAGAATALVVTCDERNAVTGSSAATNFAAANVTTTETAENVTESSPNVFTVTNHTAKGSFTVTCDGVGDDDTKGFTVVDTTPPAVSSITLSDPTGPYAAGDVLDVTVNTTDFIGLASAHLSVASGNATITSVSTRALSGASASPVFTVRLDGSTTSSSTVDLVAQVSDTTGNLFQPATLSLGVNQAATSVVTTLAGTAIEHNQTLEFACKQINAATGADTGATFALGETSTSMPGGVISSLGSNAFRVTGPFTSKGSFTVTCSKSAQSDIENVTIYDTTAPTIGTLSVVAASGPNGVTGDGRYAPDTLLTIRLSTTADAIGLSRVDLSSAGADLPSSAKFVSGTTASSVDFAAHVPANAATFSTITFTAQSSDTTGNTSPVTATLTLTVDPGAGLTVATGVTLRTLYEGTTSSGLPFGIASNGTDLFLQRTNNGFTIKDVIRLTGTTAPATLSVVINAGFPAANGVGGIAVDAGGAFGATSSIFHGLIGTAQIGTESGTNHARFDTNTAPNLPWDLALGNLGSGTRLFTVDDNGAGGIRLLKSINTGATVVYSAGGDTALNGCRAVTKDANAARLLLACDSGEIRAVTDSGSDTGNASTLVTTIGTADADDIASVASDTFVASSGDGTVYRVGDTAISTQFENPVGVVIRSGDSSSLNILDLDTTDGVWRVYRVTGY